MSSAALDLRALDRSQDLQDPVPVLPAEALLVAVLDKRLRELGASATALLERRGGTTLRRLAELETLAHLAGSLSGFIRGLDHELSVEAWAPLEERTTALVQVALEASHQVLSRARSSSAPRDAMSRVLVAAEVIRTLREDVVLAVARA